MNVDLSYRTILLVDDSEAGVSSLREVLREQYRLEVAANGAEALQTAASLRPDLVLVSINLSEGDGYSVCRRLRTSQLTNHIPVILIADAAEMADAAIGLALGAEDYITRPLVAGLVHCRIAACISLNQICKQHTASKPDLRREHSVAAQGQTAESRGQRTWDLRPCLSEIVVNAEMVRKHVYDAAASERLNSIINSCQHLLVNAENYRQIVLDAAEECASASQLRGRVLVVEDNETNQQVFSLQLTELGLEVAVADDGDAGLRLWQTQPFDLILTDLHMPGLEGGEMVRRIRELEHHSRRIPVVAVTADKSMEVESSCLAAGIDQVLLKPVTQSVLKRMLIPWLMPGCCHESAPSARISAPGKSAARAFDNEAIARNVGGNPASHRLLLQRFVAQAWQIVEEIKLGFDNADARVVGAMGHKLKSSARTVGANALADICVELEKAGKAADSQTLNLLIPRLDQEMQAAAVAIQTLPDQEN